jgi:hypothetical protein
VVLEMVAMATLFATRWAPRGRGLACPLGTARSIT